MHLSARSRLTNNAAEATADILDKLFEESRDDLQICFWDGSSWGNTTNPRLRLVLKHPGIVKTILESPSELTLGEAYIYDDLDIEGDIQVAFELADRLLVQDGSLGERFHLAEPFLNLPVAAGSPKGPGGSELRGPVHSKDRDRQAVRYHYDLPTEFYATWLDQRMVYSSAYFGTPDEDLDSAQVRKMDYICKKLHLHAGERLLDIGCGWGGFIKHAVAHYGVEAVGITLSVPQAEVARRTLSAAGLNHRSRIEVCDYRDMNLSGVYDKIASIGMFEHVGEAFLPEYFRRTSQMLRPRGLFLNHGIAYSATYHRRGPSFTDRYVFPDGELVPIHSILRAAELNGFEVRDVESLREHYALTLDHWVKRLESHAEEARKITSDITYRIWRLYMAGAAHAFRSGRLNLYQILMAKPVNGQTGLPLTRSDLYR